MSEWYKFESFCELNCEHSLPAYSLLVEFYFYSMLDNGRGASINMASSAIKYVHNSNSISSPTDHPEVKQSTKECQKHWKKNRKRLKRDPFPLEALKIYSSCRPSDTSEFEFLQNIALVANCFRGMMRGGEIVKCTGECITFEDDNSVVVWDLGVTKTDREGCDSRVPIDKGLDNSPTCPITSIKNYEKLYIKKFKHGFKKSKNIFVNEDGSPLKTDDVREIVQQMIRFAGRTEKCGAHSLRSGGATQAAKEGLSLPEIKAIGRWKSECVLRYIHAVVGVGKRLSKLMNL
ncbi:hypothetical protein AKO1_009651 [Acrasis kona]|uniref:Tyr recombinase domain-containing protein n=1 Tax=Acrasis kona TaxID=1008807 RepID=A0AAW2ZK44_9EUKA